MNVIQIEHDDIPFWNMTYTPALSHCRRLMNSGVDPETKLEITRNDRIDYSVRTIREGAALTVKDDPNIHFSKYEDKFKKITTKDSVLKGVITTPSLAKD